MKYVYIIITQINTALKMEVNILYTIKMMKYFGKLLYNFTNSEMGNLMGEHKILIVDKLNQQTEDFSAILNTLSTFEITNASTHDESLQLFNRHTYEYIIMDHNSKNAEEFLSVVLGEKPLQKFILLSDSLQCPVSCDLCLSKFHFVRLLKPIKMIEIFRYIQKDIEFTCPSQYKFENILTLQQLHDLINISDFSFYKYKELLDDTLYFRPKGSSNINVDELNKIQNLINEEFFTVEVLGDFCLKVQVRI